MTGGATWRAIWADDFSGTAVDTTKWNVQNNSNFGSGNQEDECYLAANTTVSGGPAHGRPAPDRDELRFEPERWQCLLLQPPAWSPTPRAGWVHEDEVPPRYAEVRIRVPRGNLYWPAFWLVGAGDGSSPGWPAYGEIDVTEIYGSKPDVSESNFHRTGGNIGSRNHNVNNLGSSSTGVNVNPPNPFVSGGTNNWHTYGVNWTSNRIDWIIDGGQGAHVQHVRERGPYGAGLRAQHHPEPGDGRCRSRYPDHGYTGQESGSGYSNGNLVADLPGTMEVDYVRVWQP